MQGLSRALKCPDNVDAKVSKLVTEAPTKVLTDDFAAARNVSGSAALGVALLTGGQDRPYACELAMALTAKGVSLDVIGNDDTDSPEFERAPRLRYFNLLEKRHPHAGRAAKLLGLLASYARLMWYAAATHSKVLHILWNFRFEYFDRTLLMLYFKLLRKRLAITAHNVNQARRDANDTTLNRFTLRLQYRLCDHIFVHTNKMAQELSDDFGVPADKITVLRHPINSAFPNTDLTPAEAKQRLGLELHHKTMLFFGRLRPYKGLEYLLTAFHQLSVGDPEYRLIIAGESKKGSETYFDEIERSIQNNGNSDQIIRKIQFIPDADAELYFKAADVLVLPYKDIFQSGVLFLAYSFGLPVVATDVGSFRESIVEGETGFVCPSCDAIEIARVLQKYFESDLYTQLRWKRQEIRNYAFRHHSWDAVGSLTQGVYASLVKGLPA